MCLQGVGMGGKGDRREGKHEVIGEERIAESKCHRMTEQRWNDPS